jgi:hypothetical protein
MLTSYANLKATRDAPIQSRTSYAAKRFEENTRDPKSAMTYTPVDRYYAASVPCQIMPNNLTKEQQRQGGIIPDTCLVELTTTTSVVTS